MSEFDKIIGYKDVKAELFRLCDVIKNTDKYKALGVAPIGGLLLDGDPGVGKTLMANCFIKESGTKMCTPGRNGRSTHLFCFIGKYLLYKMDGAVVFSMK